MNILEKFRKLLAMPEVAENIELKAKMGEIYTDYLEQLDKNHELSSKVRELEDIADIKKHAKIDSGFYTIDGVKDIYGKELRFCLNCLYEHNLQIPMMYGIIERGVEEYFSGREIKPNLFGLTCRKCNTKLVLTGKEKGNG